MKKLVFVFALALVGLSFGLVSPALQEHLQTAQAGARLPVNVVLKAQFDVQLLNSLVDGMPRAARRVEVARILQDFSAQQQADLLEYLRGQEAAGNVRNVQSLWIIDAAYCEATPAVIQALSARAEVEYVNYDLVYAPDLLEPAYEADGGEEITWGVERINAPAVWTLGYTGAGIVCGHIDTGCNYNHPDLADHLWTDTNYPNHGWNFESSNNDPMDIAGHGTHTAGTVASDGTSGTQCGVAPDAQIMICRVRTNADSLAETQCWAAMQFCVSPPLSPSHGADLYTMSLGWWLSWSPQQALWRQTIDNVNAAGLAEIVAAGNERQYFTPPSSCRCPGNCPPPWWNPQNTGTGSLSGVISIGAIDTTTTETYAPFSSPGPCTWSTIAPYNDYAYPPGLMRPDVSAPGVYVKSCDYSGSGYNYKDGTSMATPHVAGVVCLMLEKNPALTPAVIDSILEVTARDKGAAGKDNDYGAGIVDALAAVNYITGSGGPMLVYMGNTVSDPPPGGNGDGQIDPGETAGIAVTIRNSGAVSCDGVTGTLVSGNAQLVVTDADGAWGDIPAGGTVTNTADAFEVNALGTIPPGTVVPCTVHVTGSGVDYENTFVFTLTIGEPPLEPGTIIWGPFAAPGMPVDWGLYGITYNTAEDRIYCSYYIAASMYKFSSDSLLTAYGSVALPEDSCTDLDYTEYDGNLWVMANASKQVYKLTTTGSVIRSFSVSYMDYPLGITEDEASHRLYVSDRRTNGTTPLYIYVLDTLGNPVDTAQHPWNNPYGARCVALDGRAPANAPSLLNLFTWWDAAGTYWDSTSVVELDRTDFSVLNWFTIYDLNWNMRGIECDPRDGSYWLTIMQDNSSGINNQIMKVAGFHMGVTGVEEPTPGLPGQKSPVAVQALPNPFMRTTVLSVSLANDGFVDLAVYDNNGRLVRTLASGEQVSSRRSFIWDGCDYSGRKAAPGIYFYRCRSAAGEALGKLVMYR